MTELQRRPNTRFLTLDAMRGVAALPILTRHFPDPTLADFFRGAHCAVDMFFCLSGFVLAHAYGWDVARRTGSFTFILKRVIRLYPLYFLGLVISVLGYMLMWTFWQPWGRMRMGVSIAGALFFIPMPFRYGFNMGVAFPLNPPAWSLFWELVANVLFGLFNWTARRLLAVTAIGAVLVALAFYRFGSIDVGDHFSMLLGGGARMVYSFFLGALLYSFRPNWNWRIPAPLPLILLPLALVLPSAWDIPIALVFFPMLVFLGSMTEPGPRLEGLFKLLGNISYSVYVLHFSVIVAMTFAYQQVTGRDLGTAGVWGTLAGMVLSVIFAALAARHFDPPARKWMTNAVAKLGKKRAARSLQGG